MSARLNFDEKTHIIGLASPVDTTSTTVNSDIVNCGKYHSICFIVYFGTITGDTVVVTVEECDDFTPSASTAIAFRYRLSGATGTSDAMAAAPTAVAATGLTIAATDDDKILMIEVDGSELTDGYPNLRVVADPGGSASAVEIAILAIARPRYAQSAQITAIA